MGSSTSRTAAMDQSGSRTQLPSLVLAAGTLLLLLFGTSLLADIPSPAIGAIVAVAILPLLGIREFRRLWQLDRFEFLVAATCFLVTLFIGSIPGILVAFVLALVNLAKRAANPAIDVLATNDSPTDSLLDGSPAGSVTVPGVVVIRLAAPLFFANGDVFSQAVKRAVSQSQQGAVHDLVIDMEAVSDVDVTAAESFAALKEWLRERRRGAVLQPRPPGRPRTTRRFRHPRKETVYPTNRAATRCARSAHRLAGEAAGSPVRAPHCPRPRRPTGHEPADGIRPHHPQQQLDRTPWARFSGTSSPSPSESRSARSRSSRRSSCCSRPRRRARASASCSAGWSASSSR